MRLLLMKGLAVVLMLLFFLSIAAVSNAQSLTELAEIERQRRNGIAEAPKAINNDNVAEFSRGAVSIIKPIALPSRAMNSEAAEWIGGDSEKEKTADSEYEVDPDEPVDLAGRPESFWRDKMAEARQRVEVLEREAEVLQLRLNALQMQFLDSADGFRRQAIQKDMQKAFYEQDLNKENLAAAQDALRDLSQEGRRSGALPGWLRPSRSR